MIVEYAFDWGIFSIGAYDLYTKDGDRVEGIEKTETGYNVMIEGKVKMSGIKGTKKPKIYRYRKDGSHEFGEGWRLVMKLRTI